MNKPENETIRQSVRKTYGDIAREDRRGCGCAPTCCGPAEEAEARDRAAGLGYTTDELSTAPEGADLGLGCGNPVAIASLRPGETVLDLGSGGGLDCFLAARAVGETGRVIGVDMTPEMIERARENAAKAGLRNVEFRLGEIEHLPAADGSVDVVISNCVINLSPEKEKAMKEAFRVLKRGGRLSITDIVATAPLPDEIRNDRALHSACVSGAATIGEWESLLREAGFTGIRVNPIGTGPSPFGEFAEGRVVSARIEAVKP